MKVRTKFDKTVSASNARLRPIAPEAIGWAYRHLISHWAFRTPSGMTTCGECGHRFHHKGSVSTVTCPECGEPLKIKDTLKRSIKESTYFSTIEAIDGLQVQRVSLLNVTYKKGLPRRTECREVCRLWLDSKGQTAVTSRNRTLGYYLDSFNWESPIELKAGISDTHLVISDTYIYPKGDLIPELRRNGMSGDCDAMKCHPFRLMRFLLTDSRIETMMKAGHFEAVDHFVSHHERLDQCWNSYKIASRHGYHPKALLCRVLDMGRGVHSGKQSVGIGRIAIRRMVEHHPERPHIERARAFKDARAPEPVRISGHEIRRDILKTNVTCPQVPVEAPEQAQV